MMVMMMLITLLGLAALVLMPVGELIRTKAGRGTLLPQGPAHGQRSARKPKQSLMTSQLYGTWTYRQVS
jgi:hypothetical protein